MTSRRPYLIRAIVEWIEDNGWTPHILVSTEHEGVTVPPGHAEDGHITLNVSLSATSQRVLGNDEIHFSARFGGNPYQISFPPDAVLAVVARENGQGLVLGPDSEPVINDGDEPMSDALEDVIAPENAKRRRDDFAAGLSLVESGRDADSDDDSGDDEPPPRPNGPPRLRVVK